jgi:lipid A 3-O-deacylase
VHHLWTLIAVAWLACSSAHAADLWSPAGDLWSPPAWSGRLNAVVENDALAPKRTDLSDRWYTHGALLSYLSEPLAPEYFGWLFLPGPADNVTRRFEIMAGQSIFTPRDTKQFLPDPQDRPYAGWLYVGFAVHQETNRNTLDHVELLAGVVGPAALAKETQNLFHSSLGQRGSVGWDFQLRNEPGIVLSYERKWRLDLLSVGGIEIDAIPQAGGSVGNVFTYAQAGAMIRIGQNIKVDYGPLRIRPALSGTAWFDSSQMQGSFGWYLFAGAQGRAVARDIFLDGNTFTSSPRLKKEPLVADFSAGASLYGQRLPKIDFVMTLRTKELVDQPKTHVYGGVNVSFPVP